MLHTGERCRNMSRILLISHPRRKYISQYHCHLSNISAFRLASFESTGGIEGTVSKKTRDGTQTDSRETRELWLIFGISDESMYKLQRCFLWRESKLQYNVKERESKRASCALTCEFQTWFIALWTKSMPTVRRHCYWHVRVTQWTVLLTPRRNV